MRKILVTGFDPFGGESINPAYEAVKLLPKQIRDAEVIKLEVPTVFNSGPDKAIAAIRATQPDFVLCIGQAGGRSETPVSQARYPGGHRDADRSRHAALGYSLANGPTESPGDYCRRGRAFGSLCGLEGGSGSPLSCLSGGGGADPRLPAHLQMEEIAYVNGE